jgi:hypothetical protein
VGEDMSDVASWEKITLYHAEAESLADTSQLSCNHNKKSPLPFQTTDFLKLLNQIWLSLRHHLQQVLRQQVLRQQVLRQQVLRQQKP